MTAETLPLPLDLPGPVIRDDATLGTPTHDHDLMGPWTEDDVLRVLWRHFAAQSWAPIPQVTVNLHDTGTPLLAVSREARADRRIDLLLARPSNKPGRGPLETLAVEVKVTRADFLNDVRNPHKQEPWRRAAHRHAYAVPAGLVTRDEIPDGSGLLAVSRGWSGYGEAEWLVRAPYTNGHNPPLPTRVHVALAHRLSRLEATTRGWQTGPEAAGTPEDLRAALMAAQKAAETNARRADRAEGKAEAWRTAHALATPQGHPCRWCGLPVTPLNPTGGWFKKWRHASPDLDAPCAALETTATEAAARARWDEATGEERAKQARWAEGLRFDQLLADEPWRCFLPLNHTAPGRVDPLGPAPADVPAPTPEGDPA